MPLACIFNVLDDIQEFCYVLSHTLQLHELLNYWTHQASVIRARVLRGVEELQLRNTSKNERIQHFCRQPGCCLHDNMNGVRFHSDRITEMAFQKFQNESSKHMFDVLNSPWKKSHPVPHAFQEDNAELKQRISSLEDSIHQLIKTVESLSNKVSHDSSDTTPCVPKVLVHPPPLPPPPPPPPPAIVAVPVRKPRGRALSDNNCSIRTPLQMDMAKLLKGLKDVKLKPTAKSPGGTPMRRRSPNSNEDAVDLIRAALKRRFACIHPEDISNKENYDKSWESSPNRSFKS